MIKIEKQKPEDVYAVQEVITATWLATYPNEELGITAEDVKANLEKRSGEEQLAKRRKELAHLPENKIALVAKEDERIVGFCTAAREADRNKLGATYVSPEYQGYGIGTLLWQEAKKIFNPSKDTFLEVATYNVKAIAFFRKLGFEDTGKRFSDPRFKMKSGAIIPEMEMILKNESVADPNR